MEPKLTSELAQRLRVDCRMGDEPNLERPEDAASFRELILELVMGRGIFVVREMNDTSSIAYSIIDKLATGVVPFTHV
jgi:hypothetical protein